MSDQWEKASSPPESKGGKWSRLVVIVTNLGNLMCLHFFGDKADGFWQRPKKFKKGEEVVFWIDSPFNTQRRGGKEK